VEIAACMTGVPSEVPAMIVHVFVARLICSDTDCPHALEIAAPTLAELEALACDCGCALHVLAWPDWHTAR
jgi:hypothetical protein